MADAVVFLGLRRRPIHHRRRAAGRRRHGHVTIDICRLEGGNSMSTKTRRRLRRLRLHRAARLRVPARAQRAVHRRRAGQGKLVQALAKSPASTPPTTRSSRSSTRSGALTELSAARRWSATWSARSSSTAPRWSRPPRRGLPTTSTPPASRTGCLDAQARWGERVRREGTAARARASRRCTRPARSPRTSAWRPRASTPSTSWCCGRGSRPTRRPRRSSRSSRPTGTTWSRTSTSSGTC